LSTNNTNTHERKLAERRPVGGFLVFVLFVLFVDNLLLAALAGRAL